MPTDIVVICEGPTDFRVVTSLADRVVREQGPDWLAGDPDQLDAERIYRGLQGDPSFTPWRAVKDRAAKYNGGRGIRALSWGKGRGRIDYATTLKAVTLAILQREPDKQVNAILLSRDTDGDTGRSKTWRDIQDEFRGKVGVILAAQHPKLEAWLLNAFEPESSQESNRLSAQRAALGFDPRIGAHKLLAEGSKGRRNAKKVLDNLTGDSFERAEAAMAVAPLATLRERGADTGLAAFVEEVERQLIPLLTGPQ
jgi:hypothetical protein